MANDSSISEQDEFDLFATTHFSEEMGNQQEPVRVKVAIYDVYGNLLRQSDINKEGLKDPGSILWPLIDKCYFLTEIDGKIYFVLN